MEFDVFIIISFDPTSTFIVLHPALHPKYVIFVFLCHISFSPQILSFRHFLYATSPYSSLRSLLFGHRRRYYFCHQNIKFTFTTIVTFKQHSKPFLAGIHIFLTGNCTVCEELLANFAFLRHVQHLFSFLDLEYPSSISEKSFSNVL